MQNQTTAEMDVSKGMNTGLIIGGVIALAIGILIAPQSGRETRALLNNLMLDLQEKLAHATKLIQ